TVLLTLRADYYGHALNVNNSMFYDALKTSQVPVGKMLPDQLRQAITESAHRVGLKFESGLDNRILQDVGQEPGNLPLLEYALTELWNRRCDNVLTSKAYDDESFGGVSGAIGSKATRAYKQFSDAEKRATRALFGRLVRVSAVGTEGVDTRER